MILFRRRRRKRKDVPPEGEEPVTSPTDFVLRQTGGEFVRLVFLGILVGIGLVVLWIARQGL